MDTISNSSSVATSSSVQQRRTSTKRTKPNKPKPKPKPIKVVYISNPMKVKTSASQFRALVQELTGRDAESPPDPSRFDGGGGGGGPHIDILSTTHNDEEGSVVPRSPVVVPPDPPPHPKGQNGEASWMENFEPFDDVLTPQMIDNISALIPSTLFYESPLLDVMQQCSYVHHQYQ